MCAHYESVHDRARLKQYFGAQLPDEALRRDVWPGYEGTFIIAGQQDGEGLGRRALAGRFGLVPQWAREPKIARHTYNARSETAAQKPSFRDAWERGAHCIVPIETFFEPDWRSGQAVPARIGLAGGEPLGAAGLWSLWHDGAGQALHSFTLLTINADEHAFMRHYHKPAEEKRMIAILPPERYDDWLRADAAASHHFLQPWPAHWLTALGSSDAPVRSTGQQSLPF